MREDLQFYLNSLKFFIKQEVIKMEIIELNKIKVEDLPELPELKLEPLYNGILKELYLEMGFKNVRYLFSPFYAVLYPESTAPEVEEFISRKTALLDYLKLFLVNSLVKYSFLIEAHSYYIEQNEYTLIARFREKNAKDFKYEIKYYTNSPDNIVSYYEDKIYIGRDFVKLNEFKRVRCGLTEHVDSVIFEIERLFDKAKDKLHQKDKDIYNYLDDIKSIGDEFYNTGINFLGNLPDALIFEELKDEKLLKDISKNSRKMKHRLIEIREDLNELSSLLRAREELDFVRYVVKFRTDVVNLINYFNFKIIGQVVDRISKLT